MLPVPETPTDREPVKHNLYDLDTLISDLNTPKENMIPSQPAGTRLNSVPGSINNDMLDLEQPEPIPAEIAAHSGKMIAGTIDSGLSFGFSIYAKNRDIEKYSASANQRQQLNEAWAAVAQKYNYRVEDSPWLNVAMLNLFTYFPAFQEAQKDRRFAEHDEQLKEIREEIRQLKEARLKAMELTPVA